MELQLTQSQLLQPVLVLVVWTLIMWAWMLITRVKAIIAMKMRLDSCAPRGEQMAKLPPEVRWKADNYNHLLEQPILFYVVVICLVILGVDSVIALYSAWAFTLLRVLHSIVQTSNNKIELRFKVFVLSNIPLMVLTIMALCEVFVS